MNAAGEIGSILDRLRVLAPGHASERAKIGKAPVNVDAVLKKSGFPQRHRENLEIMTGPGLEKAKELWPRINAGDALVLLFGDRGPGRPKWPRGGPHSAF